MKRRWWKRCWRHRWLVVAKVSPPLWDPSARGTLERCGRCSKERAR